MPKIRTTFSPTELPDLYKIECECFSKEFRWAESVFKKEFTFALSKNNVWIAEKDGKIIGYLLAEDGKNCGHIITVNITKAYRRLGVASKLIALCEAEFKRRGCAEMKLEVAVENPAQILYFKLGYRAAWVKRHYYKLHSHALSMAKPL